MKKSFLVNITVFICSLFLVAAISSCKKKTGDMGPQGSQGAQGNSGLLNTMSDGYIQGTITGINKSGVAFVENFSYSIYTSDLKESYIDSVNATKYNIDIKRYNTIHLVESAELSLTASSMLPVTISSATLNFNLLKALGNNKYFVFTTGSGYTPTLSSLNYDKSTGIITGNYILNLTGSQNSTGNPASITGSFKATLKPFWY